MTNLLNNQNAKDPKVFVICKLGVSSKKAVEYLKSNFQNLEIKYIEGGVKEWSSTIDSTLFVK